MGGCHKEEALASAWFTQSGSTIITTDALSVVDHCDNRGARMGDFCLYSCGLGFCFGSDALFEVALRK